MVTSESRRRSPVRLIAWLTVLTLLVAFSIWQINLRVEFQARIDAWQQQDQAIYAASVAAENHADTVWWKVKWKGREPTTRDAADLLNGGTPLPTTQEGAHQVLAFTDPVTGGTAHLFFSGETWSSTSRVFPDPYRAGCPNPNNGPYALVSIGRRIAYMLGYAIWFFVFVVLVAQLYYNDPWHRHTGLAIDLTMLAIVSTALAMTGPNPRRALFDWFQDDSAAWGMLVIPISLIALGVTLFRSRRRATVKAPQCVNCGYNLTGNQSGVCPECGTDVSAAIA